MAGIAGVKPTQFASTKSDSVKTKSTINYTRYAYRPKMSFPMNNDKSLDSFETYTSIYQINDRSCQTSLELIDPFVDKALKKRRIQKNETTSLVDEKEFENISEGTENSTSLSNINNAAIGALGNFLFLPLLASSSTPTTTCKDTTNNTTDSPESQSLAFKHNQKNSLIKKSVKVLEKSKILSNNDKLKENLQEPIKSELNIKPAMNMKSSIKENKAKPMLKYTKLNHATCKIAETELEDLSVSTNGIGHLSKHDHGSKVNNLVSDCESEFTLKMGQEDESLEDFKQLFTKNQNLVVNWDYVQSSDYL